MDLGLAGRRAIVCASSKGLGRACAVALAAEGVEVIVNGRDAATLEATTAELRAAGARVRAVVADVTTEAGRAALLAASPEPDILINNAGGPPTGDFRDWDRDAWIAAVDANMLAPIFLMRAVVDGMAARGFGRVVNITTAGVKMPGTFGTLGLSLGARSGLTAFSVMLARSLAATGVTINALLPGRFLTDRLRTTIAADAAKAGEPVDAATARASAAIPAKRFGSPAEFGAVCAFVCSVHAGYLTGQNLLVDGGVFPGSVSVPRRYRAVAFAIAFALLMGCGPAGPTAQSSQGTPSLADLAQSQRACIGALRAHLATLAVKRIDAFFSATLNGLEVCDADYAFAHLPTRDVTKWLAHADGKPHRGVRVPETPAEISSLPHDADERVRYQRDCIAWMDRFLPADIAKSGDDPDVAAADVFNGIEECDAVAGLATISRDDLAKLVKTKDLN